MPYFLKSYIKAHPIHQELLIINYIEKGDVEFEHIQ